MATVYNNVRTIQKTVTSLSWEVEYEGVSTYVAILSTSAFVGIPAETVALLYIGFDRARRGLPLRTRSEVLAARIYTRNSIKA